MKKFLMFCWLCGVCLSGSTFAAPASFADDPAVEAFITDFARRENFDPEILRLCFAKTAPDARVLKLIQPAAVPERQRSWQRYRARFLDAQHIDLGRRFMLDNAAMLAKAQALYGVPQEIIAAIIGVETFYGRITGKFSALTALSTLAFGYPPRADFFRKELENLLLLARENNTSPLVYQSSYAGALGLPQFMPSSLRAYAVDFDGDGKIDLANSTDDAIGSVAHFLARHGWQEDGPIAVPAQLSAPPLAAWLDADIRPVHTGQELQDNGVSAPISATDKLALIPLETPKLATEYWLGYPNFYVITRYNRSSFYAMAVFQLAQALNPPSKKDSP
ncbi:MAG: lytic murein transglycosylase B [Zoogloeaceae bacterium]|jgi:membrane-bound lytic murein transglycosylase B|nr:lytic murein transglycosylase B [Zoogloeaceae bacterium]